MFVITWDVAPSCDISALQAGAILKTDFAVIIRT